MKALLVAAAMATLTSSAASAATATWTSWTSDNGGTAVYGTVSGVSVTATGAYAFDQLNDTGTDYWTTSGVGSPDYTQGLINRPTGPDIIALNTAGTETITFSAPVTNPYIALMSYNGADVTFSSPYTLVSEGCGVYGCGAFVRQSATEFTGSGEATGVIQLLGTFTSFTMTDSVNEYWHGFTIGIGGVGPGVPEPATWALMVIGAAGLGGALRARRRAVPVTV